MSSERAAPPGVENLVLRQLHGLRREFAAVLENQRRDRELLIRLDRHMEERFTQVDEGFKSVRRDLHDMKSDLILLENGLLSRHSEILEIVRRLDEGGFENLPADDGPGQT